jgi:hypothetical protein
MSHVYGDFFALICNLLLHIALPVVSERSLICLMPSSNSNPCGLTSGQPRS